LAYISESEQNDELSYNLNLINTVMFNQINYSSVISYALVLMSSAGKNVILRE